MSQSGSFFDGTLLPDIETLTGNAGGAVGPDGAFNINILGAGFIDVTGNPGTNTLTITVDGTLAQDFVTDAGTATPAANTLNVLGGELISTVGAGDTVTINLDRGTNGQLLIAATGAITAYANLISTDGTVVITNGVNSIDLSSPGDFLTITGNAGGAVGPDGVGNLDLFGSGFVDVTGNPGTNTLTITVDGTLAQDFVTNSGTATPVANILNVLGGENINTAGAGNTVTVNAGATEAVIYLNSIPWLHNFSNISVNNIFIGKTSGNFTNNGGIAIGIGTNTFNALTTGSGTAVGHASLSGLIDGIGNVAFGQNGLPLLTSGDWNISIGGQNTLNRLLTGLHNIVIGPNTLGDGDAGNRGGNNYTGAEQGNILIARPGVTGEDNTIRIGTQGNDLRSQDRCFIAGIFNTNPATNDAEPMVIASDGQMGTLGTMTDGEVMIGSTGADPVLSTLTAGTNITITNAAGSITINSTASGLTWNEETGTSESMLVNNGYIANNAGLVTFTLPTTAAIGDIVRVTGKGAGGWRIAQNAGETIFFGAVSTTTGVGGRLDSTDDRDTVELVCVTANNDWNVLSVIGNITVT